MIRVARLSGLKQLRACFSEVIKATNTSPIRREYLQFSKHRLIDFGELPAGEIPDAIKYVRPTTLEKLTNGVRLTTEYWVSEQAAVTVTVKAGSRHQTLATSSVATFAAQTAVQGTGKYSKQKIEQLIDAFGGQLKVEVGRELTQFTLSFEKQFLNEAVDLLSEIVLNPTYDTTQVQANKGVVHKNASTMDPYKLSVENIHYVSYRDHFFGQPSYGIRDNVYNVTSEQVKQFHHNNYIGNNIVVSAAGNVNANAFNSIAGEKFSKVTSARTSETVNSDQPFYTPSLMFQRDDELYNSAFVAAFEGPTWSDPDFFAMQFFKRIIGEWRADKGNGVHLNSPHLQYNSFHTYLGNFPDIIMHKPFYFAYSDTALFGNFIYGNEMFNNDMAVITQNIMSDYAQHINQVEVFRARNKYWNQLLEFNDPAQVSWQNSKQVAYLDRLISRTEVAKRISHMTPTYLNNVATKWFWDKETTVAGWGNLHNIVINAHYNRTFKRATLGTYSYIGTRVNW